MASILQPTVQVDATCGPDEPMVVRLTGQLVARTAPVTRRAIEQAIAASQGPVVVDLADVTAVDAAGLMAITAPAMSARRASVPLTIVPPADARARIVLDRIGVVPILNRTGR